MPDNLARLFERPVSCREIDASLSALRDGMQEY
jgi:hypothetical protein